MGTHYFMEPASPMFNTVSPRRVAQVAREMLEALRCLKATNKIIISTTSFAAIVP
jgi:hypothetical protein